MPAYLEAALAHLAGSLPCGYARDAAPAAEPTALAGLALAAHGQTEAARTALQWLADLQASDGSVGISQSEVTPCWPTGLALLAWSMDPTRFRRQIEQATAWILAARGKAHPRSEQMGHDSTLIGWPWVSGTHSWIEPTAWNIVALKAAGCSAHPRTREAVRLLVDRLLPSGGCNYGNTAVLGQHLRPHVQPTGLTLVALAGEAIEELRVARSLEYLERELSAQTPVASLCYGLLGLAAHGRYPEAAGDWLAAAAARNYPDWRLALVALAALGTRCPLLYSSTAQA